MVCAFKINQVVIKTSADISSEYKLNFISRPFCLTKARFLFISLFSRWNLKIGKMSKSISYSFKIPTEIFLAYKNYLKTKIEKIKHFAL